MDFVVTEHLGFNVSKRNENHALVDEERNDTQVDSLLTTTLGSNGGEGTGGLTNKAATLPETTARVQEGLGLGREGAKAATQAEEEAVVLSHLIGSDDGVVRFGRSTHLSEDFFTQSLGHLVDIAGSSGGFDPLLDGFRQGCDVSVHGVLNDGDLGGHLGGWFGRSFRVCFGWF